MEVRRTDWYRTPSLLFHGYLSPFHLDNGKDISEEKAQQSVVAAGRAGAVAVAMLEDTVDAAAAAVVMLDEDTVNAAAVAGIDTLGRPSSRTRSVGGSACVAPEIKSPALPAFHCFVRMVTVPVEAASAVTVPVVAAAWVHGIATAMMESNYCIGRLVHRSDRQTSHSLLRKALNRQG